MTAPALDRVAPGLYALTSTGEAAAPAYWAGYRARGPLPEHATLADAWQDPGGAYVFLAAPPGPYEPFVAALDALLAQYPNTRVVWLANPADDPVYWQATTLAATAAGTGPKIAWTVARDAVLAVGGYAVTVRRGTALTPSTLPPVGPGIAFAAASFGAPDGTAYPAVAGTAGIPLAGPVLGCAVATLTLDNSVPDDMTRLDVGLRYALPDPRDPTGSAVLAVPMPLLARDGAALPAYLAFDPLYPLVANRSALALSAPGSPLPAPPLRSLLTTTTGDPTTLTPLAATATRRAARLVFATSPRVVGDAADPLYYLTPDGAFRLAVAGTGANRDVALGLTGLEYVDVGTGVVTLFQAGRPAYLPGPDAALEPLGTTAYVSLLPESAPADAATEGLTYYAQPWQAPLYTPAGKGEFLRFHEMAAGTLTAKEPPVLPVGVYSGIPPDLAPYAAEIERAALAPARRAAVPPRPALARAEDAPRLAVTPSGLLAKLSTDGTTWSEVVFANLPGAATPELVLSKVGPSLQALLQSPEVFAAVADVTEFFKQSSVGYLFDDVAADLLRAAGVPPAVVTAVATAAGAEAYPTEGAFVGEVETAAGAYLDQVRAASGNLKAVLQDWTFQLSPRSWRTDPATRTVLLVKFASRPLSELAADVGSWGWPAAAGPDPRAVSDLVQGVFRDAAARAAADPAGPYARFHRDVVTNPGWNGVLVLNAPLGIAELPADLQFVSAGIDPAEFYAHHVGFSLTPFERSGDTITLHGTAAFGLIAYDSPEDLYADVGTRDFAFKTQQLTARFANAALADFAARVQLMTNRLFGSELTKQDPTSGNNLVLLGGYQRQNGAPTYAFTLTGRNDFAAAHSVLLGVEVLGVQVQTAAGAVTDDMLAVDFVVDGNLRFAELPHSDVFSYGPDAALPPEGQPPFDGHLRFGNLAVRMTYDPADPRAQSFAVTYDRMAFDLVNSAARTQSLAAGFPVTVTGLVANPVPDEPGGPRGQTPEDLGYTGVLSQLDASLLSPPWFGLVLALDLGTLGALAGSAGMSATLLAGWSPGSGSGDPPVYLGLRLASADATTASWPVQGVLKLGFRGYELMAYDAADGIREYLLRLRRLALSVLALSFPPGDLDVLVFGDPERRSRAVGWYAGYDGGTPKPAVPGLATGRRALPEGTGWAP